MGKEATSKDVVHKLLTVFSCYGIPEIIYSDGGPQFRDKTEFALTSSKFNIHSIISSPYNSQSNGDAKNAVKQMKHLIHCNQLCSAQDSQSTQMGSNILLHHNTPCQPSGYSPAQLLFGREI